MNKKIRELCMKAISDVDGIQNPDTEKMYIPDCFRDKFAQLIIDECVNVCLSQRDPQNLNYKPSVKFADEIKRHFW
jgi:hypothetical protein